MSLQTIQKMRFKHNDRHTITVAQSRTGVTGVGSEGAGTYLSATSQANTANAGRQTRHASQ